MAKSFPRLTSLWTGGYYLYPNNNFASLILSVVTRFNELIQVIINKDIGNGYAISLNREALLTQNEYIKRSLRNTDKLRDLNRTKVFWRSPFELQIWL